MYYSGNKGTFRYIFPPNTPIIFTILSFWTYFFLYNVQYSTLRPFLLFKAYKKGMPEK